MNHHAGRESKLMKIVVNGTPRFFQAKETEEGNWTYYEGKKTVVPESKYGPKIIKRMIERSYHDKGKDIKVMIY